MTRVQPVEGSVVIRDARPDEIEQVADLHTLSQRTTYLPLLPGAVAADFDAATNRASWRTRRRTAGEQRLLVAVAGAATGAAHPWAGVVGLGLVNAAASGWSSVDALHVHPGWQGAGIGGDLLREMVATSQHWHRDRLRLFVVAENHPARRCYEHLGWRLRGPGPTHRIAGRAVSTVRYDLVVRALATDVETLLTNSPPNMRLST